MSDDHSVTILLGRLKAEDSLAAEKLWTRYMERLVRLARRKLGDLPRRAADEEDVVVSAYHGFLDGVKKGRFMRLDDRDDLWQILVVLTDRKAIGLRRWEHADKRDVGRNQGKARRADESSSGCGASQLADEEPTPEFAAELNEQMDVLLTALEDETIRRVAILKLEGYANREIADELDIGQRSVERKLNLIRRKWEKVAEA